MVGWASGAVVGLAGVLLLAGCAIGDDGGPQPLTATSGAVSSAGRAKTEAGGSTTARGPGGTRHTAGPGASSAADEALAAVARLTVKGRAPKTGYSRARFGVAWSDIDRNGCDQRNDVLRRDLTGVTVKAGTHGCKVLSGTLHDPYTGQVIQFRRSSSSFSAVQIDHVVALADAWVMGAWAWTDAQRRQLANDPLDLLAVDAHANEAKHDGDAATWLPPNTPERCAYVARQVAVKVTYRLGVTPAERDAMTRVLDTCPHQPLPRSPVVPLSGPPSASPVPGPVVHSGAYCAPLGAAGRTAKGTPMHCSIGPAQTRARWHRAG